MDIRQIVEDTLIAPMRAQAEQQRFDDNVKAIAKRLDEQAKDLNAKQRLIEEYRRRIAEHEHLIGQLYEMAKNKAARDELLLWDEFCDLVTAAHGAIHGPND